MSALHDAISVLERIDLPALSRHPETEDAGNRVAIALGYLRKMTVVDEPLGAITQLRKDLLMADTDPDPLGDTCDGLRAELDAALRREERLLACATTDAQAAVSEVVQSSAGGGTE